MSGATCATSVQSRYRAKWKLKKNIFKSRGKKCQWEKQFPVFGFVSLLSSCCIYQTNKTVFKKKSLWLHYGYIVFFSVEEWDCRNCLEMFHLIKSVLPGILCTFTTRGHHKFKWRWTSFTVTWICFYAYFIVFIADSPYQYAAHFNNNGYIALPKSIFPRR